MIPSENEIRVMVEKAVLVASADASVTAIVKNIHEEIVSWYKKKDIKPEERICFDKIEQIKTILKHE